MTYKKFVLLALFLPLPIIFALGILLYIYDPLRLYHEPWLRKNTYYYNIRLQAKSIIDNNDFDSIIMGTSMLENTSPKEASEKLNSKYINLSISGSSLYQRYVILKYLFKNKKIKNVITSLDDFAIFKTKINDTNHFDFLYDNNPYNDFKVYINKRFIICTLTYSSSRRCVGDKNSLEKLTNWSDEEKAKRLFGGINNWIKYYGGDVAVAITEIMKYNDKTNIKINKKYDLKKEKEYIDKYLLQLAKQYKNTNFYYIISPYSRISYKIKNKNNFEKWKEIIKYIINKNYPNVKVYGFDNLDYTDDIANYKDLTHYNINMNSIQLDAIKNNTHILTTENIDEYFKIMEEKIKSYDIKILQEQIKKANLL